ncbi:glycosyltransferase family 39 protein [bacterium]|nr:MAG: glycosyltransferase family 39 protein [bacterium]
MTIRTLGLFVAQYSQRWQLISWIAGTMVAVLAFWLSSGLSIWFDEAYSLVLISQPVEKLIALTSVDIHPPFYYLYLKLWSTIWGSGDLSLRASTVICAALGVVVMLHLIQRLFGSTITVLSTPFLVVAPFYLRYAYELRMYALASLVCISATHILDKALCAKTPAQRRRWWISYAGLVAVGMYTLYITAFVWIAHGVWVIAGLRRRKVPINQLHKTPWLWAIAAAIVLYIPWLPSIISQAVHPALGAVADAFSPKTVSTLTTFFWQYQASWQLSPLATLSWLIAMVLASWAMVQSWRLESARTRRGLALFGLIVTVQFLIIMTLSLSPGGSIFNERYFADISLFAYALVAVAMATIIRHGGNRVKITAALLFMTLTFGVYNLAQVDNYSYQRWKTPSSKSAASEISCTSENTVMTAHPLLYFELLHYLPVGCNLVTYNEGKVAGHYGGYAYLEHSPDLILDPNSIQSRQIYLVYDDTQPPFRLDPLYQQKASWQWHETRLDLYEKP